MLPVKNSHATQESINRYSLSTALFAGINALALPRFITILSCMNDTILLILILLADPQCEPTAQLISQSLYQEGVTEVLLGESAVQRIEEEGIRAADILADNHMGKELTKYNNNMVIIHLSQMTTSKDQRIDAQLWLEGRSDMYTNIDGSTEKNASPYVAAGVKKLLAPLIQSRTSKNAGNNTAPTIPITTLVDREQWEPLLGALATIPANKRTQREWYYEVMAYVRLDQRDAAVDALNRFRTAYPKHFLLSAAESLIPLRDPSEAVLPTLEDELQAPTSTTHAEITVTTSVENWAPDHLNTSTSHSTTTTETTADNNNEQTSSSSTTEIITDTGSTTTIETTRETTTATK